MSDLRVVAMLATFVASMLGCLVPFAWPWQDGSLQLLRLFSAGVISSLALVHIINDAAVSLSEVVQYPVAGACALAGLLGMMILEHSQRSSLCESHGFCEHCQALALRSESERKLSAVLPLEDGAVQKTIQEGSTRELAVRSNQDPFWRKGCGGGEHRNELSHALITEEGHSGGMGDAEPQYEHLHDCVPHHVWTERTVSMKSTFMVYMLELSCLLHSVFIGLTMGLTTNERRQIALMVAVVFHQMLEVCIPAKYVSQRKRLGERR